MTIIPGLNKNVNWVKVETTFQPMIAPKHYGPEEVILEGTYLGTTYILGYKDKKQKQLIHRFKLSHNQPIKISKGGSMEVLQMTSESEVWMRDSTNLNRGLSWIPVGSYVGVIYSGKKLDKSGSGFHCFEVQVAE